MFIFVFVADDLIVDTNEDIHGGRPKNDNSAICSLFVRGLSTSVEMCRFMQSGRPGTWILGFH